MRTHLLIRLAPGTVVPYCSRVPVTPTLAGPVVDERGYPKDYSDVIAPVTCKWCRKRAGVKDA